MAPKRSVESWQNRSTGEVVYALVPVEPGARMGGRFFMAMMAAFEHLAIQPLPSGATRVFHYLLGKLDFENYIHIEQQEVGERLGIRPSNVSRAMRQLVEAGLLYRGPRAGRTVTYRLNPTVGWRGTAKGHRAALAEAQKRWKVE